jgi:hypothetical protein
VPPTTLVDIARGHVTANVTDAAFADVAVPVGAEIDGEGWTRNLDQPAFSRFLIWRSIQINVGGVSIEIAGRQHHNGSFTQLVLLYVVT